MSAQPTAPAAAHSNGKKPTKKKSSSTLWAVVCLVVSSFIFWGLPLIAKHNGPVQVEFEQPSK